VPAMTARAKGSRIAPIEVEESRVLDKEMVSARRNNASHSRTHEHIVSVSAGATDDKCIVDSCHVVTPVSAGELDAGKLIVGSLEVVEPNIACLLDNGTITIVLPACEAVEVGGDRPVTVPRIFGITLIVRVARTRLLARYHVMEDTECVAAATMT